MSSYPTVASDILTECPFLAHVLYVWVVTNMSYLENNPPPSRVRSTIFKN